MNMPLLVFCALVLVTSCVANEICASRGFLRSIGLRTGRADFEVSTGQDASIREKRENNEPIKELKNVGTYLLPGIASGSYHTDADNNIVLDGRVVGPYDIRLYGSTGSQDLILNIPMGGKCEEGLILCFPVQALPAKEPSDETKATLQYKHLKEKCEGEGFGNGLSITAGNDTTQIMALHAIASGEGMVKVLGEDSLATLWVFYDRSAPEIPILSRSRDNTLHLFATSEPSIQENASMLKIRVFGGGPCCQLKATIDTKDFAKSYFAWKDLNICDEHIIANDLRPPAAGNCQYTFEVGNYMDDANNFYEDGKPKPNEEDLVTLKKKFGDPIWKDLVVEARTKLGVEAINRSSSIRSLSYIRNGTENITPLHHTHFITQIWYAFFEDFVNGIMDTYYVSSRANKYFDEEFEKCDIDIKNRVWTEQKGRVLSTANWAIFTEVGYMFYSANTLEIFIEIVENHMNDISKAIAESYDGSAGNIGNKTIGARTVEPLGKKYSSWKLKGTGWEINAQIAAERVLRGEWNPLLPGTPSKKEEPYRTRWNDFWRKILTYFANDFLDILQGKAVNDVASATVDMSAMAEKVASIVGITLGQKFEEAVMDVLGNSSNVLSKMSDTIDAIKQKIKEEMQVEFHTRVSSTGKINATLAHIDDYAMNGRMNHTRSTNIQPYYGHQIQFRQLMFVCLGFEIGTTIVEPFTDDPFTIEHHEAMRQMFENATAGVCEA